MISRMKNSLRSYFEPQPEKTTLFIAIKPLYNLLSVLGLFPYSLKYDIRRKELEIIDKSFYINSLCAISSLITIVSFYVIHLQSVLTSGKYLSFSGDALTQLNYIMELTTLVIVCMVSYLAAYVNKKRLIKILNGLTKTCAQVSSFDGNHSVMLIYMKVRIYVIFALLPMAVLHIVVDFTRSDSWLKTFLVLTSFVLPQMIQFCVLIYIYVLLLIIKSILTSIHDQLESFNPVNITRVIPKTFTLPLTEMSIVYNNAFELMKDINIAWRAPILLTIVACFHSIISEGYILYNGVAGGAMTVHEIVNCSLWIVWQCLKIIILGFIGHDLKTEAAKIGHNLHNIPVEKEEIRTLIEIQMFSSQLLHQQMELTVYGFFPLDSTLIYNMVGAAAMYFVILVQFDKSDNTK